MPIFATRTDIRRAISSIAKRPATLKSWTNSAIGHCGALDAIKWCETAAEKRLYFVLDSVAYGIRWSEMTGRTSIGAWDRLPWKDTSHIIVEIAALCLENGDTCADYVKDCWKVFGAMAMDRAAA